MESNVVSREGRFRSYARHPLPRLLLAAALGLVWAVPAFPVAKEILQLQRDMAQLHIELGQLKRQYFERMAVLEELMKQSLEETKRMTQRMAVIDRSIAQQGESMVKPVTSMSARVDTMAGEFDGLTAQMEALISRLSKVQREVADIKNHLTTLPPPGTGFDEGTLSPSTNSAPPSPMPNVAASETLFNAALMDFNRGNYELARQEFQDYLRDHGQSVRAVEAQYHLGALAYQQENFEEAIHNFDLVLERYPEGTITPDAQYKKGMSLMKLNRLDEAAGEFRTVVQRFPHSNIAPNADAQLKELQTYIEKPSPTRGAFDAR